MFVAFLAEIYETAYPPWWARRIYLDYKNSDRPQNCCWVCDSTVKIFADDTKLFHAIRTPEDREKLQQDLDHLMEWSQKWQLGFNEAKCKVLHLGSSNKGLDYQMGTTTLQTTTAEKDLGVFIARGVYSHKWPIWVCAAPNPPLFTLTRSQTPHYLLWPVRWTPIFLSLSVRSPHKIYRDSFVHRELWNYLSLVGNWLFRTLVFGLKMSQIAPQSI